MSKFDEGEIRISNRKRNTVAIKAKKYNNPKFEIENIKKVKMPTNKEDTNEIDKKNKSIEKHYISNNERSSIDSNQKESDSSKENVKSLNEKIKLNLDSNKGNNVFNSVLRKKTSSKIDRIKEIKANKNIKEDIFCEVNDNESKNDDSKSTEIYIFKSKKFPDFSGNPFTKKGKEFENKVNNENNNNEKEEFDCNKEKKEIAHHKKTSTSETNNKESTTNANSSNVSSTVEIVNNTNPTISSKKEDNSEIDKKYEQLLLLAKRGDRQMFLDLFDQILSLPKKLVNLNYQDEKGNTALHYACDEGNLKIVEILLNANCDTNIINNEKETPLHLASKRGYFDISKKLIENGALLNTYNLENNSPIHYVCMNNHVELLIYFLTKNPKVDIENIYGKKPIDLVNDKEIKEVLENYLKNKENSNEQIKSDISDTKKKLEKPKKLDDIDTGKNIFYIKDNNTSPIFKSSRRKTITKKNDFNTISDSSRLNFRNSLPCNMLTNNKDPNNGEKKYTSNTQRIKKIDKENLLINDNEKNKGNSNLIKFPSKVELNPEKKIFSSSSNKYIKKKNGIEKEYSPNEKQKKNNINSNNLYNSINKLNSSEDSKMDDLNNNKSINFEYHRLSLSSKKQNGNSKNQNIKKTVTSKLAKPKSKFANNTKYIFSDSIDANNNNATNSTKTEEKNKNKEKIVKNVLKKNNKIALETTEKLIPKFQEKMNKKNLNNKYNKIKNTDNSLINNCNLTKISYGHKKKNILLDSLNGSKIVNKTLDDNIPSKFDLNTSLREKINQSNFVCLAQLGKGSFGEVYLVQKIDTKKEYAMKVLRKDKIIGQNLLKYAIAERNVLSLSNNPFIVKLYYSFQSSTKLFLVIEYCPNGDLSKHLLIEKRFSEKRAKFYLCEVLLALEDLHKRDIIFRDLKPDNVVLDEDGHCKLTDFGLSKEGVTDNFYAQSFCGSIAYLAPEMLKRQGHGKAVDWYLLGVLFYEMLVGITPFFTLKKEDIFNNIENAELKIPDFVSKEAAELLRRLLERNPNKRLGGSIKDAQEIKEHPYFKDVDWNKMYNKEIKPPIFMNYMSKTIRYYHKPRMFANEDLINIDSDKPDPYKLMGWSFINNDNI